MEAMVPRPLGYTGALPWLVTAVGLVLGLGSTAVIDLNLRLRNSAVTEFQVTPRRHVLLSFNGIGHLEHGVGADWITWA